MFATLHPFLLLGLFGALVSAAGPPVVAYKGNTLLGPVNLTANGYNRNATVYFIGTEGPGKTKIEMWSPFQEDAGGKEEGSLFMQAMANYIEQTKINGEEKIWFQLNITGWGKTAAGYPICQNATTPCPDILAIGTTQVAGRVAEDVIEKLDEWFIDWANEKGTPITEDMQKYTFYDYFVNGSWAGIPLVTDYRVMVYNKTTFSRLNLTPPPPVGNWSVPYFQYWTFEKMAEYAETIASDLGQGKGFKFMSTWDDELKVLTAMFRNYGLGLLDSNRKCGLRGPRAPEAVNLLRRLYIESQAADLTGFWANNEAFTNWTQKPLYPNPVDNPQLCCSDSESMLKDLPGMAIIPRGDVSWLGNVTDIEFAYLPGRTTYLGGIGFMMTKKSPHKKIAWGLIKNMLDITKTTIHEFARLLGSIPPYESAWEIPPWNGPEYAFTRGIMRRAVPVQYPLTMFEEFAELENRKPFRLLMAEMILKNATTEAVIDRTCQIIDYIFLPKCSSKNWYAELSPCQSNGSIVATFKWNTSLPCRDGQSLPATVDNITCTYIPAETAQSIAIFSLTGVFLLYVIVAAIGFVHFRTAAVIKRSGQIFGLVIIFGSALCGIGIMLGLGAPSVEKCTSMVVLIALGFSFVFGSFIAKLYRIYIIFADNDKGVKKAGSLTDKAMSRYLIGIVIVEAICIGLWGFIDRPSASMLTSFVPTVGNVSLPVCKYGTNGFAILLVYNAILVLIAAYISFQVRKVPSDFNESKVMGIAVYAVTFIAAVVIPATTQLTNPQAFHSIILFGALLATSSALIVFSGPKLFSAFKNPDSRGKSISSLGSSKNKNSGSKPQSSNVAGSQSATSGKALETFNIQGSQP